MESLLRSNERVAQNTASSSLLPTSVLNGFQANNNNNNNNNYNANMGVNVNNNNFVPSSIINKSRFSNNNGGNNSSRSDSRSNGNINNNNNNINSNSNSNNYNSGSNNVRNSTPNVVVTGNTFLTRNVLTPQPQLPESNLLYSNINSLNHTSMTPCDTNSTAPFIDNQFTTSTRLAN